MLNEVIILITSKQTKAFKPSYPIIKSLHQIKTNSPTTPIP